jgi:hypothetical protein
MCIPKPQVTNNTSTTAPAPPPGAVAQSAQAAQGSAGGARGAEAELQAEENAVRAKRKGRSGLRIRMDAGNTGGGTGLNIPRA